MAARSGLSHKRDKPVLSLKRDIVWNAQKLAKQEYTTASLNENSYKYDKMRGKQKNEGAKENAT